MGKLDGKVAIVTGGNTGIGLETARGLAKEGAHVVLAVRNHQKGQRAADDIKKSTGNGNVSLISLDLASLDSVRQAAQTFLAQHDRLDVLVNNAGLFQNSRTETQDGFETTLGVNHLGHFLFTHELRGALKDTAAKTKDVRVINVASTIHGLAQKGLPFDDLMQERKFAGFRAYAISKMANVLFSHGLAQRLEGSGIKSYALHPGAVKTSIGQGDEGLAMKFFSLLSVFFLTPEQGAKTSLHCALSDEAGQVSGKYWSKCKVTKVKAKFDLDEAADRLWAISKELTGVAAAEKAAA